MSLKVWWPLFPLLFLVVMTCLIMAILRLSRIKAARVEWISVISALLFYFLTFALGRWPWLHMPIANVAELFMLYNAVHFFRAGRKDIAWLNTIALIAVVIDFALHYILR
jgi:hypothetical protein